MTTFSQAQIDVLEQITLGATANFWEGYTYLRSILDQDSDSADFLYWLSKAIEINSNLYESEANTYIRAVTRNGLLFSGQSADPAKIQHNSDLIGMQVISDILTNKVVPDLQQIIVNDVQAAITSGGQSIGGWGGSFYYWNLVWNGSETVGQSIRSDLAEYDKFVTANAKAALEAIDKYGITWEQIVTASNAQVDATAYSDIQTRIVETLAGFSGIQGKINDIFGYRPILDSNGAVTGWEHFDYANPTIPAVPVTDASIIAKLVAVRDKRAALASDDEFKTFSPDKGLHGSGGLQAMTADSDTLVKISSLAPNSLASTALIQSDLAAIATWYASRLALTETLGTVEDNKTTGLLGLQLVTTKTVEIDMTGDLQNAAEATGENSAHEDLLLAPGEQLAPKIEALNLLYHSLDTTGTLAGAAQAEQTILSAVKTVWSGAEEAGRYAAENIAHYSIDAGDGQGIDIGNPGQNASAALLGSSGRDTLVGGTGDDILIGRDGKDTIDGADGDDIIFGGDDADTITGGEGNDYIDGGTGNDTIQADAEGSQTYEQNDVIFAGEGDDTVFISGGTDVVALGDGDDEIHLENSATSVDQPATQAVVWGGAGVDSFYFEGSAHVLSINVNGMTEDILRNLSTNALFEMFNDGREWGYDYILINIEAQDKIFVDGTQLTTATVTPSTNETGLDRFDYVFDHSGIGFNNEEYDYYIPVSKTEMETISRDDYFEMPGFEGPYSVDLGTGDYGYYMRAGSFAMSGFVNGAAGINFNGDGMVLWSQTTTSVQQIEVTKWDPTIYYLGEHKAYWQVAEYEPDGDPVVTVDTNEGYHVRPEGFDDASAPTIDLTPFQKLDVNGTEDDDTIAASSSSERFSGGGGSDTVSYAGSTEGVVVDLTLKLGDGGARGDQYHSIENIVGSSLTDGLFGDAGSNIMSGGGGIDYLFGDGGADQLNGDDGDDYLYGWDGDDVLSGGDGDDTLSGGYGNDVLHGGNGNDVLGLDGDLGNYAFFRNLNGTITVASGDEGVDVLSDIEGVVLGQTGTILSLEELVSTAPSVVAGTQESDVLAGTAEDDVITTFEGDDIVIASLGSDIVDTGEGTDIVKFAGPISDYLVIAVDANRVLIRGAESDTLVSNAERLEFGAADFIDVASFLNEFGPRSLVGTSRGETLAGGSGNDAIYAGGGSDVLISNGGNDHLDGGDGNDSIRINGPGVVDIYAGSGTDTIILTGERAAYEIDSYQAGNLTLHSNSISASISEAEFLVFDNGQTQETVRISDFASIGLKFVGTEGRDYLFGTERDDTFEGKQGNDDIYGGNGNDVYRYSHGDGSDRIYEGSDESSDTLKLLDLNASDILAARNGDELRIYILGTSDVITVGGQWYEQGYQGLEKIEFADGTSWDRDTILAISAAPAYNGPGDDTLAGTDGNDVIQCGPGNDLLLGGAGEDVYVYKLGDGSDYIDDEANEPTSVDTLRFEDLNASDLSASRNGINLDITVLATGDVITIDEQWYNPNGFWGMERIEFADGTFWDRATIMAIQRGPIVGTNGDDVLYGTSGDDVLQGLAGNDTLNGGDGNDSHFGGDGDDLLIGNVGADSFDGGAGNDTLDFNYYSGDHAIDLTIGKVLFADGTFEIAVNIENVIAGAGANQITGTSGDNRLDGGFGDDTIMGGGGNDILIGGDGNDTLSGGDGDDRLSGGVGADTFDGGDGFDIADFSYSSVDWSLNLETGRALADGGDETLISIEGLVGSSGNDTLVGNSQANLLDGGFGNDHLTGAAGNDTFIFKGAFGHDTITDFLAGGGTDDIIEVDVFTDFASILAAATQVGGDTLITADTNSSILLKNVALANLHQDDFRFTAAA